MKSQSIVFGMGILIAMGAEGATAKTLYSASFRWNDSASQTGHTLKIIIAKTQRPRFNDPKLIAKIMDGQRVEAICRIQGVESYVHHSSRGNTLLASSVDLSCKGTALGALGAPATVYFPEKLDGANANSTSRNMPVLRFGTWLQGYQQAVLKTEFDQSARLMSELKEIIRPGAEHVKLARAQ